MRVGLLGGSFNPAHSGHREISLRALKLLGLDQVWWVVSPQNPLKPARGMADLDARLVRARAVARHHRIRVTDIERSLGTRYTAETLDALKRRFPGVRFVWIMGADNLAQLPEWKDWTHIFRTVPIAIFNRPSYAVKALAGEAARRFRGYRVAAGRAAALADRRPPAWLFVWSTHDPHSATALRAADGADGSPERGGGESH